MLPTILILLSAVIGWSAPNGSEAGLPYVRYYAPRLYGAQGQIWAIAQDRRGIMYFANNDGVLEYDGVSWRLIPVAAASVARSLGIDENGRIWVGGRGDFGFLEPDSSGSLQFHSLLDRLPKEDQVVQDVWSTIVTRDAVYFSSFQRVIIVSRNGNVRVLRAATPVTRLFPAKTPEGNATVYAHQIDAGLMQWSDGKFVQAPGGSEFAKGRIGCVVPTSNDGMLVATREGIFAREGDHFSPWQNEASDLLKDAQVYSCVQLSDGSLAVATLRRGAFIIGQNRKLLRRLEKTSGIPREVVAAIFQDREGGLWLGTDSGIARVESPSPLTFFDDRSGLKDTVVSLTRDDGLVYAGALTGLFRLKPVQGGMPARFEPVPALSGQVYDLLSTEHGLLVAGAGGVKQVRHDSIRSVASADTVFDVCRSKHDPSTAYAMGPFGLIVMSLVNGQWTDRGRVAGIRKVLRRCAEDDQGRVWLGTDFQGVLRMDASRTPPLIEEFGAQAGLPEGWTYPFTVAGKVVFTSRNGILEFEESSRKFAPSPSFSRLFPKGEQPLLLSEEPSGQIWVGARSYSGVIRSTGSGYQFDPTPLRRANLSEIIAFHSDEDNTLWVGSAEGIVRLNPSIVRPSPQLPVSLRMISSLRDGSVIFGGFQGDETELTLPYGSNAVRFEFAAPSFDDETATEYRFHLGGADGGTTPWMREHRKDFTNIPEGDYRLEVEARNLHGTTGKLSGVPFSILPPWYRTFWAYLAYGCALLALIWGLVQWRIHQLNEQNRRLQLLVEQRTEEIRHKQAELERTNTQLVSANEELLRLNIEKNEFMGIAAHDLKNPLGAIRGYAEMLEEEGSEMDPAEITDAASRIQKSANFMFSLVSKLLDANRIERGLVKSEVAPCDLGGSARRVAEGYRERAAAKGIAVHIQIPADLPLAMADSEQLDQILDNMVSNAVKYSPFNKSIWVGVESQNGAVRFSVRDEGPGITAEDRKRLFANFARLSAKPTAGEHSTGLGLSIVKRLTEQMGGTVWCESEPGQGATFVLELPEAGVTKRAEAV